MTTAIVPGAPTDREKALYEQLAEVSTFNPRANFEGEGSR